MVPPVASETVTKPNDAGKWPFWVKGPLKNKYSDTSWFCCQPIAAWLKTNQCQQSENYAALEGNNVPQIDQLPSKRKSHLWRKQQYVLPLTNNWFSVLSKNLRQSIAVIMAGIEGLTLKEKKQQQSSAYETNLNPCTHWLHHENLQHLNTPFVCKSIYSSN